MDNCITCNVQLKKTEREFYKKKTNKVIAPKQIYSYRERYFSKVIRSGGSRGGAQGSRAPTIFVEQIEASRVFFSKAPWGRGWRAPRLPYARGWMSPPPPPPKLFHCVHYSIISALKFHYSLLIPDKEKKHYSRELSLIIPKETSIKASSFYSFILGFLVFLSSVPVSLSLQRELPVEEATSIPLFGGMSTQFEPASHTIRVP